MMTRAQTAGIAVGIAAVFQLFFRFEYIHAAGGLIYRVDRLGATTCESAPLDRCNGATWPPQRLAAPIPAVTLPTAPPIPTATPKTNPYEAAVQAEAARAAAVRAAQKKTEADPYAAAIKAEEARAAAAIPSPTADPRSFNVPCPSPHPAEVMLHCNPYLDAVRSATSSP